MTATTKARLATLPGETLTVCPLTRAALARMTPRECLRYGQMTARALDAALTFDVRLHCRSQADAIACSAIARGQVQHAGVLARWLHRNG